MNGWMGNHRLVSCFFVSLTLSFISRSSRIVRALFVSFLSSLCLSLSLFRALVFAFFIVTNRLQEPPQLPTTPSRFPTISTKQAKPNPLFSTGSTLLSGSLPRLHPHRYLL